MSRPWLLLLIGVALAGCGESSRTADDGGRPSAAATPTPTPSAAASPAPAGDDRAQVEALVADWQRALRAGDARTACGELLARDAQQRISDLGGSCERDFLADRIAEAGPDYRMEITALELDGDRGRMTVRETGSDGVSTREQPVVREGGRWRLALEG